MPTYTITTNRETCAGDKVCTEEAPNTFMIDYEGKSLVVVDFHLYVVNLFYNFRRDLHGIDGGVYAAIFQKQAFV